MFPAPREVDRFLYAPIRLRGREREAVQFPAPLEGDRGLYEWPIEQELWALPVSGPSRER